MAEWFDTLVAEFQSDSKQALLGQESQIHYQNARTHAGELWTRFDSALKKAITTINASTTPAPLTQTYQRAISAYITTVEYNRAGTRRAITATFLFGVGLNLSGLTYVEYRLGINGGDLLLKAGAQYFSPEEVASTILRRLLGKN